MKFRTQLLVATLILATAISLIFFFAARVHAQTTSAIPHVSQISVMDAFTLASVIIAQLFTAGAVYGAIKSDLRHMHEKIDGAHDTAKSAHARIDDVYERLGERRR